MIKIEELTYGDEILLTIGLDENDKSLILVDKYKNTIRLGAEGISFESPKDIRFKAEGNVDMKAAGKVGVAAAGDLKMKGMRIDVNAQTSLLAKANASAELSASGQTIVKGAMVMIN